MTHRDRRLRAGVLLLAGCAALAPACAPARFPLAGDEARSAFVFFSAALAVPFPVRASFAGTANVSGRVVPFIAAVDAACVSGETVGIYDPMGRAVFFVTNDGRRLHLSRGPAADAYGSEFLAKIPPDGVGFGGGAVSLGRLLAGAPAFPVDDGTTTRAKDGGWVYADGRQTLFTDPARRVIVRAEYDVSGKRMTVSYPERSGSSPPGVVAVELRGMKIVLRRDKE